jgi:LTXXQ motif family protein
MMLSNRAIGMAALLAVCFTPAFAEERSAGANDKRGLSQIEFKVLTDARLGLAKAALQLTPEQQGLWPPVESAVRARADSRYRRLTDIGARIDEPRNTENPVKALQERADSLSERGAQLRKVAEAWQPLYQSLNPDQKSRMGVLVTRVLGELRSGAQSRRYEMDEEDDESF